MNNLFHISIKLSRHKFPHNPAKSSIKFLQYLIPSTKHNLNLSWLHHHHFYSYTTKIQNLQRDRSMNQNIAQSNLLVTELSRQRRITEARKVFDEMSDRDVVTWTCIISGYIKCRMIKEARMLFDRSDARKNVVTWTALIGGYIKENRIDEAERLFECMPDKNVVSWNTMINGYAQNGDIDRALELFEKMPSRNVVSSNTVITALAQRGRIDEARRIFDEMLERDVISWTAMVTGLSRNGRIDEARELFDRMPERNVVSWNAMVTGYMQNKRLDEAFDLFVIMPMRDVSSWNTIITGYVQNGEIKFAWKLFNQMHERNVVTWTTMISGHIQDGQSEAALKIFSQMLAKGIRPNQGTFVSVLNACSDLAGICEGQQIHQAISKTWFQNSAFVESALINMYSKCGELKIAREMFNRSTQRDLVTWNSIIAAYAHHGCGKEAILLMDELRKSGFKPDDVTYIAILSACGHSGFVDEGLKYFEELVNIESIKLREDHYSCLVDLCGRAGRMQEAYAIIKRIGTKASACVWGALLAGCNVHGNVELGRIAAKKLLEVEPENAGTYMLLSNIYASAGEWKEAKNIRSKMKEKGLKKQPGCSWIEVENRVHVFVVRDNSHTQTELINSLIRNLHVEIKRVGYVPHSDSVEE
ncbi:hypothetical protein ACHQM5_007017 [Ranunculus cassubicifolius]